MEWIFLTAIATGISATMSFCLGYYKRQRKTDVEYYDDENLDEEINKQKEKMDKFVSIVGEEPMKQIDWIIENGFKKFNDTYDKVMSGEHVEEVSTTDFLIKPLPRPSPQISPNLHYSGEIGYVRGGMGNKKLASWTYARTYTCSICEHVFNNEYKYVDLIKCPKCGA